MKVRHNIHRGAEEWQSILQEFDLSNLTQEQFCLKHNLVTSTFCRWKKQLSSSSTSCSSSFIEIQPEHAMPSKPNSDLRARFELAINVSARFQLTLKIT